MGSGSKTAHKHAAPAIGVAGTGAGAGGASVAAAAPAAGPATAAAAALHETGQLLTELVSKGAYQPTAQGVLGFLTAPGLQAAVGQVKALHEGPDAGQLTQQQKHDAWAAVAHPTAAYLSSVPPHDLVQAALKQGFPHPGMVGHGYQAALAAGKKAVHPLAVWLNPFYTDDTKQKIAAKAEARFAALSPSAKSKALAAEEKILAQLAAPAPVTGAPAPEQTAPPVAAVETAAPAPATPVQPQPAGAPSPAPVLPFQQKLMALTGILAQRQAADRLPAWKDRAVLESLALRHARSAEDLGGVHEKHLYADPSGQMWLFKVDKHGGAAAAAEEAAATVARRVGLPSVQSARVTLDGATGSLQPFLGGAGKLPGDPAAWTPAQVQGVMMHHVADWLVGDHDGNVPNFLLVEGAPVRVDRGQAWKFAGSDRLALDYEPNKQHGAPPHAAILLYRAARAGKVQVNPHFVLPVVQAAEAIPDDEYRAMLRPVADAGAAPGGNAGWRAAAAKRAQQALGRSPTPAEVADAFLDMAVERKHRLRQDFENLFSDVTKWKFSFGGGSGSAT